MTGFSDNYWIGLSLLHTLFVKEHNAICDHLRGSYPTWDDEQLFLTARLVNSALMAKIHTVEWTPGILANPVLERAMHANWYGLLPQWVRRNFGHLGHRDDRRRRRLRPGAPRRAVRDHRGVRLGLPAASAAARRLRDPRPPQRPAARTRPTSTRSRERPPATSSTSGGWRTSCIRSGSPTPGRSRLKNHPRALANHVRLTGERVDLGTIDILRDRERGVSRYNDFREKLRKTPDHRVRRPHRRRGVGARDRGRLRRRHRQRRPPGRDAGRAAAARASASATRLSGSSS